MMGFDKDKRAFGPKNFKYLDDLIHGGAKEIVLDSDIVLSDSEESEYEGGIKLDVDDLTIDGNGHTIDAQGKARIFCCRGKNINVKNIVLKNGLAQKFGGAIYNDYGELTIAESAFSQNAVWGYGGAVYNSGELTILKSALNANTARTLGGAIYNNSDGRLTIAESLLRENTSDFKAGALYNSGNLILTGSSLKGNCAQRYGGAIVNVGANIRIEETSFANNESQFPLRSICNDEGGRLKLLEVHFDGDAIVNHGRLAVMGKFSASQSKAIFNRGYAVIESEDVCKSIENAGIVDKLESPTENQRDFTYLNELICSGTDEISLEHDILLNIRKDVNETFCDGIEIDRNDLTIDGNGHSIDALGFARIFRLTGKNITLKNITLKNGFAPKDGAAIYNEGELTVSKSGLSANVALYDGGAIYNGGELTVSESELSANTSNHNGGAIHNRGELTVCKSYLSQNSAKRKGGAVFNYRGEMTLIQSELAANAALSGGGAIYNYECKSGIAKSRICENTSQRHGGAIFNENGELAITESALNKNGATGKYGRGGAIYSLGKLALERCELAENTALSHGGAIHNSEGEITIAGSSLTRNATKSNGGAVYNDSGKLSIAESGICENTAQGDGGAIDNWGSLAIEDCALKANTAQNGSGGAIYAIFGELSIKDSAFARNAADGNACDIFNDGLMVIEEDMAESMHMHNTGELYHPKSLKPNQKGFTYLNEVINAGCGEIKLENDIVFNFEDDELKTFREGIEIDRDNLVIDGNGHAIDAQCLTRIFHCSARNVRIKNITFKNGRAVYGGAICNDGELSIADCAFTKNSARYKGGAICNVGELTLDGSSLEANAAQSDGGAIFNCGVVEISESALKANTAKNYGGAVYNLKGEITVTKSVLANNATEFGGAVYNYDGEMRVSESTFSENTARVSGGAVLIYTGEMRVSKSILAGNVSKGVFGGGGAVYNYNGEMTVTGCTLMGNAAEYDGGAIYNRYRDLVITKSALNENTAQSDGGAIYNGRRMTVTGCTLMGNAAQRDGGAIDSTGELTITESALTGNTAQGNGGAICLYKSKYELENCTFKDNEPGDVYEEK